MKRKDRPSRYVRWRQPTSVAAEESSAASYLVVGNRFTFRWTLRASQVAPASKILHVHQTQFRFQREPSRLTRTEPQMSVDVKHKTTKSGWPPSVRPINVNGVREDRPTRLLKLPRYAATLGHCPAVRSIEVSVGCCRQYMQDTQELWTSKHWPPWGVLTRAAQGHHGLTNALRVVHLPFVTCCVSICKLRCGCFGITRRRPTPQNTGEGLQGTCVAAL